MSDEFWKNAEAKTPEPSLEGGGSGYFSAPDKGLDPALFNGESLKPEVRHYIINMLDQYIEERFAWNNPKSWIHIWLAGSGVSHQWAADRGNGDLDVLFGVDMKAFAKANPDWAAYSEDELAPVVNEYLKRDLWPVTANHAWNGKAFEVTFYWNPGTGADIQNINPYAAIDVQNNKWAVKPDPKQQGPDNVDWAVRAGVDTSTTRDLVQRHNKLRTDVENFPTGSPGYHDATARINLVAAQARALFDDIHLGRKEAFAEQGHGYADWHNYRWQSAKKNGVVQGLAGILTAADEQRRENDLKLYGGNLKSADDLVRRAAMGKRFEQ